VRGVEQPAFEDRTLGDGELILLLLQGARGDRGLRLLRVPCRCCRGDVGLGYGDGFVERGVDDDCHAGDVSCGQLGQDGLDGVFDPGADLGMAVLVDGEVESFRGEEGSWGINVAVEEDVVDGDG